MTRRRSDNYLWVSWLSKLMAGEEKCLWSSWFRVHYQGFNKAPSDFDLACYNAEHNQAVLQLAQELEAQGQTVYTEGENEFKLQVAQVPKLTLSGRPDIVAIDQAGEYCVYDVKTGRPKQADQIQVLLYMLCLPSSTLRRCWRKQFKGAVAYRGVQQSSKSVDGIDQDFKKNVRFYVDTLNVDAPPKRSPNAQQCRYCDITLADCDVRIERNGEEEEETVPALDWEA